MACLSFEKTGHALDRKEKRKRAVVIFLLPSRTLIRNGSTLRKGGRNDESYNFRGTVRPEGSTGGEVAAMTTFQCQLYWRCDDGYEQETAVCVFNVRQAHRY